MGNKKQLVDTIFRLINETSDCTKEDAERVYKKLLKNNVILREGNTQMIDWGCLLQSIN